MNNLNEKIEYYPNGNVMMKLSFDENGNGIEEVFYENGNTRRRRTPYKEGIKDGIEEWFYPNGNIYRRTPYKEGKKDGIEEWFDERGNINETRVWKDGELIEETKH